MVLINIAITDSSNLDLSKAVIKFLKTVLPLYHIILSNRKSTLTL
jgi:hypothetical protein